MPIAWIVDGNDIFCVVLYERWRERSVTRAVVGNLGCNNARRLVNCFKSGRRRRQKVDEFEIRAVNMQCLALLLSGN